MVDAQSEVEAALERDDPNELMDLVIELATDGPDRDFAETCCVRLARHRNAMVRGNALLGFGHLARRFGRLTRGAGLAADSQACPRTGEEGSRAGYGPGGNCPGSRCR